MTSRILLVEDNELNLDMLSRRLGKRGFQVIPARDGQTGVEVAISKSPDLILMDIGLPTLNGLDAARRLKSAPSTRHIPIVALTAHAIQGDEAKALEAGCDAYQTKPVRFEELIGVITNLLSRKGFT